MKFDELIEKYVILRDQKALLKADYDQKKAGLDALLDKMEAVILKQFDALGTDSVKTSAGTAYRSMRTSATVADWDALLAFIQANGAWEMLEHRCNKTAIEQFKSANDDLPPGVNFRAEAVIGVRRS